MSHDYNVKGNYTNTNLQFFSKKTSLKSSSQTSVENNTLGVTLANFSEKGTKVLTETSAYLNGINQVSNTNYKSIAENSNKILKDSGYNYKVTPSQVASVESGLKETVIPGMQLVANGAVEKGITDPNGPFASLFVA